MKQLDDNSSIGSKGLRFLLKGLVCGRRNQAGPAQVGPQQGRAKLLLIVNKHGSTSHTILPVTLIFNVHDRRYAHKKDTVTESMACAVAAMATDSDQQVLPALTLGLAPQVPLLAGRGSVISFCFIRLLDIGYEVISCLLLFLSHILPKTISVQEVLMNRMIACINL